MKLSNLKKSLIALSLSAALSATASAEEYAVIVNANNTFKGSETRVANEIRLLFLKEKFRWGNGLLSIPISVDKKSDAFNSFRESVLGMSKEQLRSHWVRIKQLNGDPPPREVHSERLITRLVARDNGAFGVVTTKSAQKAGDKVKVLFTF